MLSAAAAVLVLILFFSAIWFISCMDVRRKRRQYIREKFGRIPKNRDWNEAVGNYYDIVNDGSGLDDVTWNDLSMNEVFQRMDQCDTSAGEEILYWKLRKNHMSGEEREILEKRIRFFSEDEKEREAAEGLLCEIGKNSASYYIPAYLDGIEMYELNNRWIYRGLQLLLAASFLSIVIVGNDVAAGSFLVACAVNLAVYFWFRMKREIELSMAGTAVSILENAKKIAARKRTAELFPELKKELGGLKGVMRGYHILSIMRAGHDSGDALGVLADYIMGITLCQITTYNKVLRRLRKNAETYLAVYRYLGELDVAICLASFRKSLPWYCTPEFADEKRIRMEEAYHPLIEDPVANSLDLTGSCLITGSNASGKSTFIKAVALNGVLAQSVNTCAAERFVMPESEVITSMAVKDDLMAGESYFIREIRYLKRILDNLNEDRVTVCAIDEILRGTNTGERIRASRAILEYLKDKNCIALVATHDKELTELLGDAYLDYHFSEEIGEDDIAFSYKIMEGPATSQNAVKLLEFAGFPKGIIEAAQRDI